MGIKEKIRKFVASFVKESDWKFVTSGGATLSVGTPIKRVGGNATAGAMWVKKDSDESPTKLTFIALGASVGLNQGSPFNFSFSLPKMPSAGTVYQLPLAGFRLTLSELKGAYLLLEFAGDLGGGGSWATMFVGGNTHIASLIATIPGGPMLYIPAFIASSKGCVSFGGATATLIPANVSATVYSGRIF